MNTTKETKEKAEIAKAIIDHFAKITAVAHRLFDIADANLQWQKAIIETPECWSHESGQVVLPESLFDWLVQMSAETRTAVDDAKTLFTPAPPTISYSSMEAERLRRLRRQRLRLYRPDGSHDRGNPDRRPPSAA